MCLLQTRKGRDGSRRIPSLLIYFNKVRVFQKAKGSHLPQCGWDLPTASPNLLFPYNSIRPTDGSTQPASSFSRPFRSPSSLTASAGEEGSHPSQPPQPQFSPFHWAPRRLPSVRPSSDPSLPHSTFWMFTNSAASVFSFIFTALTWSSSWADSPWGWCPDLFSWDARGHPSRWWAGKREWAASELFLRKTHS